MTRPLEWILVLALLVTALGCEDDVIVQQRGSGRGGDEAGAGADGASEAEEPEAIEPRAFRDEDFVEADTNRDPFRNYASSFQAPTREREWGGRDVVMSDTGLDDMRLIAIVTRVPNPYAMLLDRHGTGHTVRRGTFLGRSEVVQSGGLEDLPVHLNWRVDRIRAGELVLTREDPTAPNRPPLTRVIPLREDDAAAGIDPR